MCCVVLLVSACGGEDAAAPAAPTDMPAISDEADRGLSPSVEEVRKLKDGADVIDNRSAACRMTHAVLIAGGKPRPVSLTVQAGDCIVWGNHDRTDVVVQWTAPGPRISNKRATGALFGFVITMGPRTAGRSIGPFMSLSPREAFEQVTAERAKAKGEAAPDLVPYAYASTNKAITVRYTLRPTGATGSLVLTPAANGRPSMPRERFSAVERVRDLRGGIRVLNERPATCRTTHAIRFIDGRPQPAKLIVPAGACVVWGNEGDVDVDVESRQECTGYLTGYRSCVSFSRAIGPRSAAAATEPLKRGLRDIPYTATLRHPRAQGRADGRSPRVAHGTIIVD
jgi:hypothetical protein